MRRVQQRHHTWAVYKDSAYPKKRECLQHQSGRLFLKYKKVLHYIPENRQQQDTQFSQDMDSVDHLEAALSDVQADSRIVGSMKGLESSQLVSLYDDFALEYEAEYVKVGYEGPKNIANTVRELMPEHLEPLTARVLDAGCGVGLIGRHLLEFGFTSIHGIDFSSGMLKGAADKGYASLSLGNLMERLEFNDGEFDVIASCGVFTSGHVKPAAFDELVRVTNKGGLLCLGVQDLVYEKDHYPEKVKELESKGLVKQVAMKKAFTMRKSNTMMNILCLERL